MATAATQKRRATAAPMSYSDFKPAWHQDKIAQMRAGEQIIPSQIQLIISDLCNHDCGFCAFRMEGYTSNQHFGEMTPNGINNNPNRMVDYDKCIEIMCDAATMGVGAIQFTGGGEPTVHPRHMEIFRAALDFGLESALVTNGNILRKGWEEVLPRFAWIRVSLDAGSAATYAKIRRVPESKFMMALQNLKALSEATRNTGTVLGASFIITKENYLEVQKAAEVVARTGCPSIRFAAVFTPDLADYYNEDMLGEIEEQLHYAEVLADQSQFTIHNQFSLRMGDLRSGRPAYSFCGYQEFNVYIGGDLNVYRCCNTAYNDLGLVGSLQDQSFADFWKIQEKAEAYGGFDARACEHCAFNEKNRLINYLVSEAPDHVNFV